MIRTACVASMTALVVRWRAGTDVAALLERCPRRPAPVEAELDRLRAPPVTPPGWDYLWYLGPGEIYRPASSPAVVISSLAIPTRKEMSVPSDCSGLSVAAITWGMPEPLPSGVNRRVATAMAVTPIGVTSRGNHQIAAIQ